MQEKITHIIKEALVNLGIEEIDFVVEHPEDLKNGDYSTNVAMVCAKKIKNPPAGGPKELAEKIKLELEKNLPQKIEKIEVAGAGFINFYLSQKFFAESIEEIVNQDEGVGKNNSLEGKKIMVEYTDPNPFKPFHIGHLMTNAIGESIARILEASGADVSRANYQGDVGLHIAKAIWGINHVNNLGKLNITLNGEDIIVVPPKENASISEKAKFIGICYYIGSEAYEDLKKEIDILNKKIYDRSDEEVNQVYDWGFKITMEAFEDLYKILGTKFDFYFLESQVAPFGLNIVNENIGRVFEKSDGAVVFKAEKYDPKLHTRVFLTSAGLPTYETKELGLTVEKFNTEPNLDLSITITANEQMDYMRVVYKALSLIHPEYEHKMKHITHGMMRFASGKMGSRKGNVVTGESLIRDTIALVDEKLKDRDYNEEEKKEIAKKVGVSALKYSILKQSTGGDIIYDFEKSISFEGDSGPYLQYSYARANSIIEKAKKENILPDFQKLSEETFEVEKMLYRFPEIVLRASKEYEPHYIANYLIELARSFNSFYGNNLIVKADDPTSSYKVAITFAFSFIIKKGLNLLGIEAPEKM
jgi:arginyl-tRNA synthetase